MKLPSIRQIGASLVLSALLALPLLYAGCGTTQLEQGGAYSTGTNSVAQAVDLGFYRTDAAFSVAYAAIDGVFDWEKRNRLALWHLSPSIKHSLDAIRPEAVRVRNDYTKARKAYLKTPTPAGLSNLETALAAIQNLNNAAQAVMPQGTP